MTKESLEEIRERLIRDERVRQMIRVRAYEIYQMRGPHPGGQAQDWFEAEEEVLAFLIADESQRADEKGAQQPVGSTPAPVRDKTVPARTPKATRTSDAKKPVLKRAAPNPATSKKPVERKPKRTRKPKPAASD